MRLDNDISFLCVTYEQHINLDNFFSNQSDRCYETIKIMKTDLNSTKSVHV